MRFAGLLALWMALPFFAAPQSAQAAIDGIEPVAGVFDLIADAGYIKTPDGGSILNWGYGVAGMQYPGPTLIVTQNDVITVNLTNNLGVPTSIVFPGQDVTPTGGVPGLLTSEALPNGGTVSYSFTPDRPGTFIYHSGTEQDLQVEMGLVGALIVRPDLSTDAYGHASTADDYNREFLFLLSEIDINVHQMVEQGMTEWVDTTTFFPEYWLINGRAAPDNLDPAGIPTLPNQPYNSLPFMYPGERLLLRIVGAGRQRHPFHHHGNHAQLIARDAELLTNDVGDIVGPLLFTVDSVPGQTADAVFTWTGEELGWDVYGTPADGVASHSCNTIDLDVCLADDDPSDCGSPGFDVGTNEYCPDHGKRIPVTLPEKLSIAFGGFWGGSPYLGVMGSLPPGEGGLNPWAGYTFPWHSHTEKELLNNDIFPGGMLTMLVIVPPGMPTP